MVTSLGLPLLIVNGKFHSLNSMTVEDLETFIPFLVKCSINSARARLKNGVPEWWLPSLEFQFPLRKPPGFSTIKYHRLLATVVCHCYWYHNAQYLLPFSAKIARRPESVLLKDNNDNTTSIFCVNNTAHIMKFSNENKNYDIKPKKNGKTVRRCLLPSLPRKTNSIPDIYLCENCDGEFSSHTEMQKHERICGEIVIEDDDDEDEDAESSNGHESSLGQLGGVHPGVDGYGPGDDPMDAASDSDEDIEVLEHIKPREKTSVMNYFGLQKVGDVKSSPSGKRRPTTEVRSKRWVNVDKCLHKNRNVEFSSLFGRKMLEGCVKRDLISKIEKNISVYETYCRTNNVKVAPSKGRNSSEVRTNPRRGRRPKWVHTYAFGKSQRLEKYETLKTGLDKRSRDLLKQCKDLRIVLHRLKLTS